MGALALLRVVSWRPARNLVGDLPGDGLPRLSGVVHVHTTLSDGGGTPEEVIRAAQETGLGFLVITDHNTVKGKKCEGYAGRVLVLVGAEVSTTAGHVLGVGIDEPGYKFSGDASDALDDIRDLHGFPFAAHPLTDAENFVWTGWDLPGPWGIELLNGDTGWRSAGWGKLLRTVSLYPFNPRLALLTSLGPPADTLKKWDAMLQHRDVPALCGADAHNRIPIRRRTAIRFPSYQSLFDLTRTHVLLERPLSGDAAIDVALLTSALKRGRSYIGVDALAAADRFGFVAEAAGRRYTMGETLAPEPPPRFKVGGSMPRGTRLRLLRDGKTFFEGVQQINAIAAGPGVYRVEGYVPGTSMPWVLTNPIYVFDAETATARARAAAWPEEGPAPDAVTPIDDFETPSSGFAAEFDSSSSMSREVRDATQAASGRSSARLSFRLGAPGPGRPYTWCALVNREPRDLTGRTGLVFWLKADGVYRMWVQVRDQNPASADEGTEWWFASVRTSRDWRRVAIPFSRLRTLNPKSDGRLDLDRVRGLVFVLDTGAVEPGTAGNIWIDALGAY